MKLTIDVPEGEYCIDGCSCPCYSAGYCMRFRSVGMHSTKLKPRLLDLDINNNFKKCPACLAACQQYRDEHDYEKAREILDEIPMTGVKFALKALKFDKEVK